MPVNLTVIIRHFYNSVELNSSSLRILHPSRELRSVSEAVVAHPSAPGIIAPPPRSENILIFKNILASTDGTACEFRVLKFVVKHTDDILFFKCLFKKSPFLSCEVVVSKKIELVF